MIDEVRVRVDAKHPQHAACLELARIFGMGYIFDQKGPKGQLAQAAPEIGIPTIDPGVRWVSRLGLCQHRKRDARCAEHLEILRLY